MPSEVPTPLSYDEPLAAGDGEARSLYCAEVALIREAKERWHREQVAPTVAKMPLRQPRFSTLSDVELPDLVTPADKHTDYLGELGMPGVYPFTRGVQPTMYRGRLWTMRQFAGFGSPE